MKNKGYSMRHYVSVCNDNNHRLISYWHNNLKVTFPSFDVVALIHTNPSLHKFYFWRGFIPQHYFKPFYSLQSCHFFVMFLEIRSSQSHNRRPCLQSLIVSALSKNFQLKEMILIQTIYWVAKKWVGCQRCELEFLRPTLFAFPPTQMLEKVEQKSSSQH